MGLSTLAKAVVVKACGVSFLEIKRVITQVWRMNNEKPPPKSSFANWVISSMVAVSHFSPLDLGRRTMPSVITILTLMHRWCNLVAGQSPCLEAPRALLVTFSLVFQDSLVVAVAFLAVGSSRLLQMSPSLAKSRR